jgi:hypothetical protein
MISIDELKNVIAIDTHSRHVNEYQTWGYIFNEGDEVIVYSGDIEDGDFIFRKLKKKKIGKATVFHEISFKEIPGHTHYSTLKKYLDHYSIYGYHCNPTKNVSDNPIPLVADHPEFLL